MILMTIMMTTSSGFSGANSSIGRASALHAEGRGFDSHFVHKYPESREYVAKGSGTCPSCMERWFPGDEIVRELGLNKFSHKRCYFFHQWGFKKD